MIDDSVIPGLLFGAQTFTNVYYGFQKIARIQDLNPNDPSYGARAASKL